MVTFYDRDSNGEIVLRDDGSPVVNECAYNQCVLHDLAYQEKVPRKIADKQLYEGLKKCVHPFEAWLTYKAVRLFGWSRWG